MNIVFYSTCSNIYEKSSVQYFSNPSCCEQWNNSSFLKGNKITVVTQKPGMFLIDLNDGLLSQKARNVDYIVTEAVKEEEIASIIAGLKPDLVIAASFWVRPFDWLSIKDALVAEHLKAKGIKVICHKLSSVIDCFDKWRTHNLLEKHGFNVAKAVYVHHELYMNSGNRRELTTNVYRDSVLTEIKQLKFPVIIKDTTGLSSFGMDKVDTFAEVETILKSKRFTSDRIVEEYIPGQQFGTEIHGSNGNYRIFDPFFISTNQYGITSPKQNVKFGPVTCQKYDIEGLKNTLLTLARKLELNGIAQVDLIFDGTKWFIVEINPRLSGMSQLYALTTGSTVLDNLYQAAVIKKTDINVKSRFALDIKFPLVEDDIYNKLKESPAVKFIQKTINPAARQIREAGFIQIITGCCQTLQELKDNYLMIKPLIPQEEQIVCENYLNSISV